MDMESFWSSLMQYQFHKTHTIRNPSQQQLLWQGESSTQAGEAIVHGKVHSQVVRFGAFWPPFLFHGRLEEPVSNPFVV